MASIAVLLLLSFGCTGNEEPEQDGYSSPPTLIASYELTEGSLTLHPVRVQILHDTLFVSYDGLARIDVYTPDLTRVRTIELTDPEPIFPTAFAVTDSAFYVVDHSKRAIVICDRDGKLIDSFGKLPDQQTSLSPFSVTCFGGVLYAGDLGQRQVMAISMVDAKNITERGELILSIPADSTHRFRLPSAVSVTPDGRLLVGDAGTGLIQVFTCDGRHIYDFSSTDHPVPIAPMDFAMDNVINPEVQDTASFDPSGIRMAGRIHVADANNNCVHLFSPLGEYVNSYYGSDSLMRPSDLAVNGRGDKIYITDPVAARLYLFSTGGK